MHSIQRIYLKFGYRVPPAARLVSFGLNCPIATLTLYADSEIHTIIGEFTEEFLLAQQTIM